MEQNVWEPENTTWRQLCDVGWDMKRYAKLCCGVDCPIVKNQCCKHGFYVHHPYCKLGCLTLKDRRCKHGLLTLNNPSTFFVEPGDFQYVTLLDEEPEDLIAPHEFDETTVERMREDYGSLRSGSEWDNVLGRVDLTCKEKPEWPSYPLLWSAAEWDLLGDHEDLTWPPYSLDSDPTDFPDYNEDVFRPLPNFGKLI